MSLLVNLCKNAGLDFDCLLSAELARHDKPDPEVYLTAARLLGLDPSRIMMVASHPFDLQGARSVGFKTAFVDRPQLSDPVGAKYETGRGELGIVVGASGNWRTRWGHRADRRRLRRIRIGLLGHPRDDAANRDLGGLLARGFQRDMTPQLRRLMESLHYIEDMESELGFDARPAPASDRRRQLRHPEAAPSFGMG